MFSLIIFVVILFIIIIILCHIITKLNTYDKEIEEDINIFHFMDT